MRITSLEINNYKSFSESTPINFGSNFNVILGRNNSGKSAVLEALRLLRCPSAPHRSILFPRGVPLRERSVFEARIEMSGRELKRIALSGNDRWWPIQPDLRRAPEAYINSIFEQEVVEFRIAATGGTGLWNSLQSPSHGLFNQGDWGEQRFAVLVGPSPDKRMVVCSHVQQSDSDQLPEAIQEYVLDRVYVFSAQRLNVGECGFGRAVRLATNASNLPQCLLELSNNPERYGRFIAHVTEILPSIQYVVVGPTDGNSLVIKLWQVPLASEREDLITPLSEAGTGVGQILAILYVAMTLEDAVIAIDEPSNFLHPGAVKALISILSQYSSNQYILDTHSTDVISISDPSTVNVVSWLEGRSEVQPANIRDVDDLRHMLSELGVSLADIFGAESIIWVEGETEQECFPFLVRAARGALPKGLVFLSMRGTSEVERNNQRAVAAIDLYGKLSDAGSIMPRAIAFSFDRELRSQQNVADLERRAQKTRVLPRRMYENYLIDSDAIAALILREIQEEVDRETVAQSIRLNYSRFISRREVRWPNDSWIECVDGAKLLHSLIGELTGGRLEYRKIAHGAFLTNWLLAERRENMQEAIDYVLGLLE